MTSERPDASTRASQAWSNFCQALLEAGEVVLQQSPPGDDQDCAEGFRYLSRLVRSALEQGFETGTPRAPTLEPMYAHRTSIAQRNPDQIYLGARLAGQYDYLLSGRRGSGGALSFVSRASGRDGGGEQLTGHLDDGHLVCAPDGTFCVAISSREHAGNWLPMSATSDMLMVRELFGDPHGATPSVMGIERMGGLPDDEPLSIEAVDRVLLQAGGSVRGLLERFGHWTLGLAERPNRFWTTDELLGREEILRVGGSPGIDYRLGYWRIAPGQALLIDAGDQRDGPWSFQLMNHWQENLNIPWSSSHINAATAHREGDGRVRIVVAASNPGTANWVGTTGHDHGVMLFRWFGPEVGERPSPTCQPVALADLDSEATMRSEDRSHQIAPGYLAQRIG